VAILKKNIKIDYANRARAKAKGIEVKDLVAFVKGLSFKRPCLLEYNSAG